MSKIWEFFENLGEYVYVADAETHELIYMNKKTPGNRAFRLDTCIVEIAMNVKVKSKYGYSFEIERQKSYIGSLEAIENTGN